MGLLTRAVGAALRADQRMIERHHPRVEGPLDPAGHDWVPRVEAAYGDIRAELDAAGGDNAPTLVKNVLVLRNNTAVAEKEFMIKLYTENVASGAPATPPPPAR